MRATNASTNDTNGAGITGRRASRPSPTAAAVDEVLNDWQKTTGHTLRPERREAFRTRHAVQDLAAVAAPVRRATAERLWQKDARLLLDDWSLESLCPGALDLAGRLELVHRA